MAMQSTLQLARTLLAIAGGVLAMSLNPVFAQPPNNTTIANVSASSAEPSLEKLRQQIQNLKDPSYRTRQLAVWYLEQHARKALPLLREAGKTTDLNIGAEIVSLLSWQAMTTDSDINVQAHEALREMAGNSNSVTAVARLAQDALDNIADRQEILAQQALLELKAELGPLRLTINGMVQNDLPRDNILYISDEFEGKAQHLKLFRFLRSFDTAYLEGHVVNEQLLREVLAMPALRRLVLKGPAITNEMLTLVFDAEELEHLEIAYAEVDDRAIDTLVDLPLVGSLRLFGTKISRDGVTRLERELNGLEMYIGRGGFLGIANLRVSNVQPGSAAERAGIQLFDLITHINEKPVRTFEDLRKELAHFAPGEQVTLQIDRSIDGFGRGEVRTMTVNAILGMQPSLPR